MSDLNQTGKMGKDPFGDRWESHPASAEYKDTSGNELWTEEEMNDFKNQFDLDTQAINELNNLYPEIAAEFKRIQQEQFELFAKKMIDYGRGNIALGGDMSVEEDKQFALTGLTIRLNDKINRLKNLVKRQGKAYVDESIEDTFIDVSNYGIIAMILQRGKW